MSSSISGILLSKTLWGHMILRVFLLLVFVGLIIWVALPLFYFMWFGSGSGGDQYLASKAATILEILIPLFLGTGTAIFLLRRKVREHCLPKAKSYAIAVVVILLAYPFRIALIDAVIRLFQG